MTNRLILFFALVLISFRLNGQNTLENSVAKTVEELQTAMIEGDKATLEKITSDHLSYGHSSGRVENKQEFVESIVSGKSDFESIKCSEQIISLTNKKVALVRHTLDADILDGGKPNTIKLKVLLVFQKEKAGWTLIARQAVKMTS